MSESHVYHVMLRGNNKEAIFIDHQDKQRIINILVAKKSDEAFYLYAYCIMDNHIHLVIKEGKNNIAQALKRIATSYAFYFNKKYNRIGHVFQDRYRSECVEDDNYLLAVIRYVHQNPWKAGIGTIADYQWSSYKAYIQGIKIMPEILDVLSILSNDSACAVQEFFRFTHENTDERFIDLATNKEITKENIDNYLTRYLNINNISLDELQLRNNKVIRNELISFLLNESNLSKRAIADVLGINRETVRMLSKEPSP